MIVAFTSYGNDSLALVRWLADARDRGVIARDSRVVCVYSDTGWAAPWWEERVARAEARVLELGFETRRTESDGFVQIVKKHGVWPRNRMRYCTEELKVKPALRLLAELDPELDATCVVGIRREESAARAAWPEWTPESKNHGGRDLWAPLVRLLEPERDALVRDLGFDVLPHRSQECYPCVNANRTDLRRVTEDRVALIEGLERDLGPTDEGKVKTMFRSHKFMGAVGIREVLRWAHSERGKYDPDEAPGGCDSGMCGG